MVNDIKKEFMMLALTLAEEAKKIGEVPVGAVVVRENEVVGTGYNKRESQKNALCHAEIEAINNACKTLNGWRLFECDIYVTLEPCPMCAGAIINSRIKRVIYGASDPKAGTCNSVMNIFDYPFNHKPEVVDGVLKEDCSKILTEFFKELRNSKTN